MHSEFILREIGRYLAEHTPESQRSVLKSAYKTGVPIYVPAFTDSEMGLDVELHNIFRQRQGKPRRAFDPFFDLESFWNFFRHLIPRIFLCGNTVKSCDSVRCLASRNQVREAWCEAIQHFLRMHAQTVA